MRNMSFFYTQKQFRDRSKDVTRRLGWWFLKPGDHVMAVEKAQGLRKGEKIHKLGEIEIIEAKGTHLWTISQEDVAREGFPEWTPDQFVEMFCRHMKCNPRTMVNRIVFRHLKQDHE